MVIIMFILGLIAGSFINALVWRLHNKQSGKKQNASVWAGRSVCPDCNHELAWHDLVPIASWLFLSGKCRYCSKSISAQYPLVEFVTGLLFALSIAVLPDPNLYSAIDLGFWLYFLIVLIILSVYDLKWYLLPDAVLLPAIVVAFLQLAIHLIFGVAFQSVGSHLLAALLAGGAFYGIAAISNGSWMGGGDIKLVFFLGLILGLSKTGVMLLLAFNIAAVVGVILIAAKIKNRRDQLPFGPFLAGAAVFAQLYGSQLINWYLNLTGLNVI